MMVFVIELAVFLWALAFGACLVEAWRDRHPRDGSSADARRRNR